MLTPTLNNTNAIIYHKTHVLNRFALEYPIYIPLQNAKKMVFCNGMLSQLKTHTNRIFHAKTLKKWRSAMEYRVCVAVEPTQYPHKSYIPLQNATQMAFYNGISRLCGC